MKKYADGLLRFNEQILKLVNGWEHAVRPEHAAQFKPFAERIRQFYEFRKELARLGVEVGQAAGREWGDNDANRTVRKALNKDLDMLGATLFPAGPRDLRQDRRRHRFHRLADERARRARGAARRARRA